jgi:hypothetical protein
MAKAGLILTGVAELDAKLAKLEAKLIKKLLPTAAKQAATITRDEYQRRVPVMTGAMRDAVVIRVRRYRHKEKEGTGRLVTLKATGKQVRQRRVTAEDIGASVIIDRNRWEKLLKSRTSRKELGVDKKRGGPFFYPAVIEIGNKETLGERPLTKSLYERTQQIKAEFIKRLTALVSGL